MRRIRSAPAVVLLAMVLAAPAQAQFKLPKVKIKSPLGSSSPSAARTGAVAFSDVVLEVTDANMTRFLKGLAAERDAAMRLEADRTSGAAARNQKKRDRYEQQDAAYQAASEKWESCAAPLHEQGERDMDAEGAAVAKDTAAMRKATDRVLAAQRAGNMTEVLRLADSMSKASAAMSSHALGTASTATKRITDTCGASPQEPAKPEYEPEMTGEDVRTAALTASGMTAAQYAVFRERVSSYVLSDGKQGGGYVYTEEEAGVLKSHLDGLKGFTDILKTY